METSTTLGFVDSTAVHPTNDQRELAFAMIVLFNITSRQAYVHLFNGNSKHATANAIAYEGVHHLVSFIKNFAKAHWMPLPGRVPGHHAKVMILPSDITKAIVYTKYRVLVLQMDLNLLVDQHSKVWQQSLPQISVSKPSSDLCHTCPRNRLAIQKAGYLSEQGKAELHIFAQDHLKSAQTKIKYYKSQVAAAEASWSASGDGKCISTLMALISKSTSLPMQSKLAQNTLKQHENVQFSVCVMMANLSRLTT